MKPRSIPLPPSPSHFWAPHLCPLFSLTFPDLRGLPTFGGPNLWAPHYFRPLSPCSSPLLHFSGLPFGWPSHLFGLPMFCPSLPPSLPSFGPQPLHPTFYSFCFPLFCSFFISFYSLFFSRLFVSVSFLFLFFLIFFVLQKRVFFFLLFCVAREAVLGGSSGWEPTISSCVFPSPAQILCVSVLSSFGVFFRKIVVVGQSQRPTPNTRLGFSGAI